MSISQIRWILLRVFLIDFSKKMQGIAPGKLAKEDQKNVIKFCKYGWHFVAYVWLFIWGLTLLADQEWSILRSGQLEIQLSQRDHKEMNEKPNQNAR